MTRTLSFTAVLFVAGLSLAAEPKEEVQNAAKALGQKDNYSWATKSDISRDTQSFQSELTGTSEREGFTHVITQLRAADNSIEILIKGEKGAVKTQEGWKSFEELQNDTSNENRARMLGRFIRGMRGPAKEAEDLVGKTTDLKRTDNMYAGVLTEDAAKELLVFGRGGGTNVQVSNAKGSVKFWIKDGVLTKLSYEVEGTVSRDGNQTQVKRTTEAQVQSVGATKVLVSDEARAKAS